MIDYEELCAPLFAKLPKPRFAVDWDKWGKFRTVRLSIACGLLADLDYQAYLQMHDYYEEKIKDEPLFDDMRNSWRDDARRLFHNAESRLLYRASIFSVVRNHMESGQFIRVEIRKVSIGEAMEENPLLSIENDEYPTSMFVDLPEFGAWAKAAGYGLPPEFPISLVNKGSQKISSREMPKAMDMLESLKSLNNDYKDIDQSNIPAEMQRLILQYYGKQPTQTELLKDLTIKGIEISRPTFSKFFKLAFDDVKL